MSQGWNYEFELYRDPGIVSNNLLVRLLVVAFILSTYLQGFATSNIHLKSTILIIKCFQLQVVAHSTSVALTVVFLR